MMIYENIRLALFSLKANKMRALLTMLGIIIGIAAVIAIMTLGNAITSSVEDSMSSMGVTNVRVRVQQREEEEESMNGMHFGTDEDGRKMVETDYISSEMVQQFCDVYGSDIQAISAEEAVGQGEIESGSRRSGVSVEGVSLGYFRVNSIKIQKGGYFSAKEMDEGQMVAMVAVDVVDDIFGGDMDAAVGGTIQVALDNKYYNFIVSGVYEEDDGNSMSMSSYAALFGGGSSTSCYIPIKTAQRLNHSSGYTQFTVMANADVDPDEFSIRIENFFNNLYRNNQYFEVSAMSMSAMVDVMAEMMNTVTVAIAFIGSIALIVGGIGVMNIMLVSITERTREIGTRKAMGAPNSSIRIQFIIESIVICIVGGIIGIILGCAVGVAAASYAGVSASPSVDSIFISLGFSMAIGVFFGYYPANKAAKLNPIDALRYE
ncbi:MAG: FtsX-like permease family protein [Ruminococcus sp.]|mgnify:CR=1 FL=1|nr:FtsX-like permease family protein [Ruminococcus sp.]